MVIDCDVYLPRDFRERRSHLPLEAGLLYGVAGRKVCDEREAFEMLQEKEPWEAFLYRNSAVIETGLARSSGAALAAKAKPGFGNETANLR